MVSPVCRSGSGRALASGSVPAGRLAGVAYDAIVETASLPAVLHGHRGGTGRLLGSCRSKIGVCETKLMRRAIGLPVKLAYTAFVGVWVWRYAGFYGPAHFLWLCNLANLIVLAGLWRESRLLLSSQLLAVLAIDLIWTLDLAGALLAGAHPFSVTAYMFDPRIPADVRMLSLYHVLVPVVLIHALTRLGYDPRGLALQTAMTWLVLPLSLLTEPERDINWVWGPFWETQQIMPASAYLLLCMAGYPVILYLPAHGIVRAAARIGRSFG